MHWSKVDSIEAKNSTSCPQYPDPIRLATKANAGPASGHHEIPGVEEDGLAAGGFCVLDGVAGRSEFNLAESEVSQARFSFWRIGFRLGTSRHLPRGRDDIQEFSAGFSGNNECFSAATGHEKMCQQSTRESAYIWARPTASTLSGLRRREQRAIIPD
ncbi:MAG: hypothetical protein HY290_29955 [Planctomycetia bacterium]|nr:hypothetical protein [Planctomycetia bacterium]